MSGQRRWGTAMKIEVNGREYEILPYRRGWSTVNPKETILTLKPSIAVMVAPCTVLENGTKVVGRVEENLTPRVLQNSEGKFHVASAAVKNEFLDICARDLKTVREMTDVNELIERMSREEVIRRMVREVETVEFSIQNLRDTLSNLQLHLHNAKNEYKAMYGEEYDAS